jgi:hypothetical protein
MTFEVDDSDCTFEYFKPGSGKWMYSGRGRYPRAKEGEYLKIDRSAIIKENDGMPGINSNGQSLIVVVLPDDDCEAYASHPTLLHALED